MNLDFLHSFGFSVANSNGVFEIPFLDRMMIVFLFCITGMTIISLLGNNVRSVAKAMDVPEDGFSLSNTFVFGAIFIVGILVALYTLFL